MIIENNAIKIKLIFQYDGCNFEKTTVSNFGSCLVSIVSLVKFSIAIVLVH
jgi:hypothetical protein